DGEETSARGVDGEGSRLLLDDFAARIADGVNRMPEADNDFAVIDAAANVVGGCVGRRVALLDFERDLVGSAMLWAFESADGSGDAGIHIGSGAGDDAC